MYKLENELSLIFNILWAMDGNDSLKRVIRRSPAVDGDLNPGPSCEQTDTRHMSGDMYVSREDVNKWAREVTSQAMAATEGVSSIFIFCPTSFSDKQCTGSRLQPMHVALEEHGGRVD